MQRSQQVTECGNQAQSKVTKISDAPEMVVMLVGVPHSSLAKYAFVKLGNDVTILFPTDGYGTGIGTEDLTKRHCCQ